MDDMGTWHNISTWVISEIVETSDVCDNAHIVNTAQTQNILAKVTLCKVKSVKKQLSILETGYS